MSVRLETKRLSSFHWVVVIPAGICLYKSLEWVEELYGIEVEKDLVDDTEEEVVWIVEEFSAVNWEEGWGWVEG